MMAALAFLFVVSAYLLRLLPVLRQLVREKIVNELISHKHWSSMEISSWKWGPGGYTTAIKNKFVWGASSRELLALSATRRWLLLFRAIVVLEYALLLLVVACVTVVPWRLE